MSRKSKGISAAAFMAGFSSAGRVVAQPKFICEHENVRVERLDDVNDEYVMRYEAITCRDCGTDLVEKRKGQLVARRAA